MALSLIYMYIYGIFMPCLPPTGRFLPAPRRWSPPPSPSTSSAACRAGRRGSSPGTRRRTWPQASRNVEHGSKTLEKPRKSTQNPLKSPRKPPNGHSKALFLTTKTPRRVEAAADHLRRHGGQGARRVRALEALGLRGREKLGEAHVDDHGLRRVHGAEPPRRGELSRGSNTHLSCISCIVYPGLQAPPHPPPKGFGCTGVYMYRGGWSVTSGLPPAPLYVVLGMPCTLKHTCH